MHFLEVNVQEFSCLHFALPVHFIGLDGDQILQIVVEYGDPVNGKLEFNVWCSFLGSGIRGFLMSANVAETNSQIDTIMEYLQNSYEFAEMAQKCSRLSICWNR